MKPDSLYLVLCALCVFRVSLMLSKELGPFRIFERLRNSVPKSSSFYIGIRCLWCVTVWIALPVSVWFAMRDQMPCWLGLIGDVFVLWNALSSLAIVVNQQWTKG